MTNNLILYTQQHQHSVPNFEKGGIRKKLSAWRTEEGVGVNVFLIKKNTNYDSEGTISNVDVTSFSQATNYNV